MDLDYIHAKFLGWSRPRSTSVSMSGYLGPAKGDIKECGYTCIKGQITHIYRIEIEKDGNCYIPDLTQNRKRLKKRVEQGLFKVLTPNVNLEEKSPCDALIRVSKVEDEKQKLLDEVKELKAKVKEAEEERAKKTPVKRGIKPGRKPTIKTEEKPAEPIMPEMEGEAPDME